MDLQKRTESLDLLGSFFRRTWAWASELRASSPALELIRADNRKPSEILSHESIDGRRAAVGLRPTSHSGAEVFRHWNLAATHARGSGHTGFLETMRLGSESFAAERFPETVNE